MSMSDHDLLRQYARDGSQAAFATLVDRHINLVYSAARRQVNSPQLTEEVAQSVFIDLARHAPRFNPATPLVAWLHVVARRTAIDIIRREARRQAREHHAAACGEPVASAMKPSLPAWDVVEPLLDEAVDSLDTTDRAAILLRYFENKTLREVGVALGASEDAAQKRVSRAVEQLRTFFLRRGVTVTAAGLASDLSAHALHVAPAGLSTTISAATSLAAAASAATLETARLITMTTLQKSVVLAVFAVVAGVGFYQARLIARHSDELAALREQDDRATAEVRQLHLARAAAAAKLKDIEQRIDDRLAQARALPPADAALETQMQEWLTQITRIKEFLAQRPEWDIPELKLLTDQDWFDVAATNRIESEEQFRRTTSRLRDWAVGRASQKIMTALNAYLRAHDGELPANALALAPDFDPPMDPAILARYEMLQSGKLSDVPRNQSMRILAPTPADVEYDAYTTIGTNGYGNSGVAMGENVREARRQFASANGGQRATAAEQLLPYLKWPVTLAALKKYLEPPPTPTPP